MFKAPAFSRALSYNLCLILTILILCVNINMYEINGDYNMVKKSIAYFLIALLFVASLAFTSCTDKNDTENSTDPVTDVVTDVNPGDVTLPRDEF